MAKQSGKYDATQKEQKVMTIEQRKEIIDELVGSTMIRRSYYEGLSDERLLQEIDKLKLIY